MKQNEAQFVNYQFHNRLCRAQVVVADLVEPPKQPKFEVLFTSPWMRSVDAALAGVLPRYFAIYFDRQGFKHPDDPSRTPADAAPDACVVTMRAA